MARFFVFLSALAAFSTMQVRVAFAGTTVDADAKPYLVFGGVYRGHRIIRVRPVPDL